MYQVNMSNIEQSKNLGFSEALEIEKDKVQFQGHCKLIRFRLIEDMVG